MNRLTVSFRAGLSWCAPGGLLIALLAGCAGGPPTREDQADASQCRALVSAQYDRQNRGEVLRDDQHNSPFSSNGAPGVISSGLGTQFGYDQQIRSCVRGSAANVGGGGAAVGQGVATPTITIVPPAGQR